MHTNNNKNMSISCNVNDCKYHAGSENYCTLNKINVVKHGMNATSVESTDCGSFEACCNDSMK